MKKINTLILVMTLFFGLIGNVTVKAALVSLNVNKKTIYAGSIFQLKLKNANGDIVWKSSKESVAQVLPCGIVVGLKKGKATITATYMDITYGCTVTVKNPTIDKTKATMRVDDTLRLKMKGNNAVSWSSSDKKVATVDDGGLVKALMVGTTIITAKCEDGNEYTSEIKVNNYGVQVGDTIKMGHYEQDNNTFNGKELIEWEVLEVKDGKALLISKDVIDYIAYTDHFNSDGQYRSALTTWDDSATRYWLNKDFYEVAFSKEEKELICLSTVTADLNPEFSNKQGKTTQDKVFLLSIKEVQDHSINKCKPTEYTISKGVEPSADGYTYFFLRTYGQNKSYGLGSYPCISFVDAGGKIRYEGSNQDFGCIRPAIWITVK